MGARKIIFILLLIFGQQVNANVSSLYGGEYEIPDYFGLNDAIYEFDRTQGVVRSKDQRKGYFDSLIEKDLFGLLGFWDQDLSKTANCPDDLLAQHKSYIHYLYRLLIISYTFEGLKQYDYHFNLLGQKNNSCKLKYEDIFKACKPTSGEMKKFVDRVQYRYDKNFDYSKYEALSSSGADMWVREFQAGKKSDFLRNQMYSICGENFRYCPRLTKIDMKTKMEQLCERDKKLIQDVCSERDNLYGISYTDQSISLLAQSNAFTVINKEGRGQYCLERFSKLYQNRERKLPYLSDFFYNIFEELVIKRSKYLQGSIFLPGALKEFDDKGLVSFLYNPPPPLIIPKLKKYVEEPIYVKPEPVIVKRPKPKPVIKKIVKAKPKKVVKKKELSAVKKALQVLGLKDENRVAVDMVDFQDDFIFTEQSLKSLEAPLQDYQSRSALQELKAYESLGSAENPMPLIFLKYLIDTESHQGLFNIQSIIGKHFYIRNDIDREKTPVFLELNLDNKNYEGWKLFVIDKESFEKEAEAKYSDLE
jgi:hypothetical protein